MTGTIEIEVPEAETIEDQVMYVEEFVEDLLQALTQGPHSLFEKCRAANEQLLSKEVAEQEKALELRETARQFKSRVEARQRILSREVDEMLADGRDRDAEEKRRESAKLESDLADILKQAEACEMRAGEAAAEQGANFIRHFNENFPQLRAATVRTIIAAVGLLDGVEAALRAYQLRSGLPRPFISEINHLMDLTPREQGFEQRYWQSLQGWFNPGQRLKQPKPHPTQH